MNPQVPGTGGVIFLSGMKLRVSSLEMDEIFGDFLAIAIFFPFKL